MANWGGVLSPAGLPDQLTGLQATMQRMVDLLATIAARSKRVQDRATWHALPFVVATPASVVSVILSGDTAGLYNLVIGGSVQPGVYLAEQHYPAQPGRPRCYCRDDRLMVDRNRPRCGERIGVCEERGGYGAGGRLGHEGGPLDA